MTASPDITAACRHFLGAETADRIIADKGPLWAAMAAWAYRHDVYDYGLLSARILRVYLDANRDEVMG